MGNDKDKSISKNMNTIKDMLLNPNNHKHSSNISSLKNVKNKTPTNLPQNFFINQAGVPCFNNINIFTTNTNTGIKTGDINLRQYIFNKDNKTTNKNSNNNNASKNNSSHLRNGSNNRIL